MTPEFHSLDFGGRYIDVMEMYCGSARIASLCEKVSCLVAACVFAMAMLVSTVLSLGLEIEYMRLACRSARLTSAFWQAWTS